MPINKKCAHQQKKVCECLQIFGWKTVSIQCCPLFVYPRFRPRLLERLSSTQNAHQQKMWVNVCRYLGEKLSLSNDAPLLYIPCLGLDSKKITLNRKRASTKNVCECLQIFGWKLSLSNVAPLLYIPGWGLDSKKDYAQPKKRINKKYVWMLADIRVKNCLYSMFPYCIFQV